MLNFHRCGARERLRGRRCRPRRSEKRSARATRERMAAQRRDDNQALGAADDAGAAGVMAANEDTVLVPSAAVAEPDGLSLLWQQRRRARLSLHVAARCSGVGSPRSLLAILCTTISSSRCSCSWRIRSSTTSPLHRRRCVCVVRHWRVSGRRGEEGRLQQRRGHSGTEKQRAVRSHAQR